MQEICAREHHYFGSTDDYHGQSRNKAPPRGTTSEKKSTFHLASQVPRNLLHLIPVTAEAQMTVLQDRTVKEPEHSPLITQEIRVQLLVPLSHALWLWEEILWENKTFTPKLLTQACCQHTATRGDRACWPPLCREPWTGLEEKPVRGRFLWILSAWWTRVA